MEPNESLEKDLMENYYFYFVQTLSVLGMCPEEQCAKMGYYNSAWELREDALDVDYLLRQEIIKFTEDQIEEMKELSSALHVLGSDAIKGGRAREDHVRAMSHSDWQVVRDIAKKLIVTLAPRTEENRKYFESQAGR